MTDAWSLAIAFAVCLGLGGFFFGGLWWTVQRIPTSSNPALLALGSLFSRIVLTVAGFYFVAVGTVTGTFVADGDWRRLLSAVAGFLIVRQVMIQHIRPPVIDRPRTGNAASSADTGSGG